MKKFNYKDEIFNANEILEDMFKDNSYISWLVDYLKDKEYFTNNKYYDFKPDDISDYDAYNIEQLHLFYTGINKYAIENCLLPFRGEGSIYYRLKYNNILFDLSIYYTPDVNVCVSKTNNYEDLFVIDVNSVIKNKNVLEKK